MEGSQIDLYEFLTESELQHYYNAIKNELKITNATQFKYATDEDLKNIGLSRPEIRRLRKYYEKYFPHGYFSKIKRLLQTPTAIVKRDDVCPIQSQLSINSSELSFAPKSLSSPSKVPNNKHIIPADSITVNKQLGTGEFGIVQQGVWTNGNERIQVAIKCLCRERMQSNPMEFLKEAAIMHSIEHENIVRLYGVVLATDSLMLVTELAHLRSLLECLKDPGLRVSFLTIPTLCEFAMQICNGMRYLENKRLIHRDLAARNILVFSKSKVKISDFGLSRALGVGKDYYKTNFNVNLKLPIAWCAPECINYLRFTNASDVWAYGVCLWEMFSYGFQPWAALTGLQILEAIDAPNYQRLEQPDCCPREHYTLLMKCWQDDPIKRPKFSEIFEMLPDMKPEQLKAVGNSLEPKKDQLFYRQGDIITVLDRNTGTPFWKGVLNSGKTGYFNPSNTVAYLEGLPSSNRDSFCRINERTSKRKLKTEMISKPQNDFKHTGHVGIDGASFGDIAFLGNSQNYNHVPHQIVTPYKPSEDIEQTPLLLPPTPTSPDSLQTASGYFSQGSNMTSINPTFLSSEITTKNVNADRSFDLLNYEVNTVSPAKNSTNPFANRNEDNIQSKSYDIDDNIMMNNNHDSFLTETHDGIQNNSRDRKSSWPSAPVNSMEDQHEYHEISDDEITADRFDFGPSLLDEINSMFGSISATADHSKPPPVFEQVNVKNDVKEMTSKLDRKNSGLNKKKSSGTVKPISVKDEKILNQAIEIANEISARSMIDLVSDQTAVAQSPKRKFSFRFPHLSNMSGNNDKSNTNISSVVDSISNNNSHHKLASPHSKKNNFTEELKSIPDLQAIIGEEGREAYNSLIERKTAVGLNVAGLSPVAKLLQHLDTNEFEIAAARTLPRCSIHDSSCGENNIFIQERFGRHEENQIPLKKAPRPMTLPTRGAISKARKSMCSEYQVSMETLNSSSNKIEDSEPKACERDNPNELSPCESPSYVTHNFHNSTLYNSEIHNSLPLPPREGKRHIKSNAKRHVRKYPLIIPANGVQRTLNKVTETTHVDLEDNKIGTPEDKAQRKLSQSSANANEITYEIVSSLRPHAQGKLAPQTSMLKDTAHTYQNVQRSANESDPDSASLHFESIMEADLNTGNVLQSPDVTDGFYNFSIQKDHYNKCKEDDFDSKKISGLYVNEDELRNLDIKSNMKGAYQTVTHAINPGHALSEQRALVTNLTCGFDTRTVKGNLKDPELQENELAGNPLFKKVRESVDNAHNGLIANINLQQTEAEFLTISTARLKDSNSVSCEDLLEFSDQKPKGCERGVDSDEVRIMMKVLGENSSPTRCLETLEFINWDVHKAIKMIKFQNILDERMDLSNTVEILNTCEWDLHSATKMYINGFRR